VKLFQIEEPDGGPTDPNEAGAAIGIDAGGVRAEVALPVPAIVAQTTEWQGLFEGARLRAERALARPVTHAVVVLAVTPNANAAERLRQAAERAGLEVLRLVGRGELPAGAAPALAAAIRAEELAPRPELDAAPDPG